MSRIDFEQHLILGNQRAFPVILFDEIARDLRLDLRVYIPIKRCDPFVVDRDVSLDDLDELDVWRRSGRCRNVLVSTSTQQEKIESNATKNTQRCGEISAVAGGQAGVGATDVCG